MRKALKDQLVEEKNSALKTVQKSIEAEVKTASIFLEEAKTIASKLKSALSVTTNFMLSYFLTHADVEDIVLHVLAITVANGGGKTLPIQAAAAACTGRVLEALKDLGLDPEYKEGAIVSLEMVFGTARCSEYVKEIGTLEGAYYVSSTVFNEQIDNALEAVRHPLPSIVKLKPLESMMSNAYRTSNGYQAMLGSKFNNREQVAPVAVVNYLGTIGCSLEDVPHGARPPSKNKFIEAGGTPNQEVLRAIAWSDSIRTNGTAAACNQLYKSGNLFYFAHSFDFRLRIYCKGYQISLQGTEFDKSIIEFYKKEYLTPEGLKWLRIATANAYGVDKETFQYRILWVINNSDKLEDYTAEAAEPLIYAKCVRALRRAEAGKPIGIPIHMDATASGFQVNGCLTACEETLLVSNVLKNESNLLVDLYTNIQAAMAKVSACIALLKRKVIKDGTIPAFYASEAEPKRVFGEHIEAFWSALSKYAGAYWYLKYLPQLWRNDIEEYSFTMPDGYVVYVPVTGVVSEDVFVEVLGDNVSISQEVQGCKSQSKCFLANITHAFDAYILRNIVRKCEQHKIAIIVIHDSYAVHPNHMEKVSKWYRDELAALVLLDPLQDILYEIFGVLVEIPRFSALSRTEIAHEILEAEYCLS
jgi:hypothetical protein